MRAVSRGDATFSIRQFTPQRQFEPIFQGVIHTSFTPPDSRSHCPGWLHLAIQSPRCGWSRATHIPIVIRRTEREIT